MTTFTLGEIANQVGGEVVGCPELRIAGVRTLEDAGPEHISFYHNRRYLQQALGSRAGALIVIDVAPFPGRDLLVAKDPYAAVAKVLGLYYPQRRPRPGIHPSAVVAATAVVAESAEVAPQVVIGERTRVGEAAIIGAGCVLADDSEVGAESELHPQVVIERGCRVGARCILHAGVVVGSDGFGFATVAGQHLKVPQVGIVVIEEDVELGANVCIDRAALGETRIGRGTKVDNLVQIAHNVRIGEHSLLVAQAGISGSTQLGHHVVMAGQSGAVGHLHIADGTVVTAKTGVTEDTEPGQWVSGFPGRPHREWLKAMSNLYRLDDLRRRVGEIEKVLAQLGGEG
jgi:UDP-3-O-[3-hydroxymyristoyl] glucosamine N-acyltransferase